MAQFTSAGGGGVPVTASISGATSPLVVQISMPTVATEYSYTLPVGCRQFQLKSQILDTLRVAYTVGGTSSTTYLTVPRGCLYIESDLSLSSTLDIYLQSNQASQVVELLIWT